MSEHDDLGLPPGLREDYLRSARDRLAELAALAERLVAAGNDVDAMERLRRESHKIHGSAGAFGFHDASRLAAGMEATVKDWLAHPGEPDVERGSATRWFVGRLAEILGLEVPAAPPPRSPRSPPPPPPPPSGTARPVPRLIIRRPSAPSTGKGTPPPRPSPRPLAPPAPAPPPPPPPPPSPPPPKAPSAPAPRKAKPAAPPPPPPPAPAEELPWILPPDAEVEPVPTAAPPEPVAATPPAAAGEPAPAVPEVIFVEDDASLAELLAYGLGARGYRFAAYRNGREALRELLALDVRGTHPLLLLDVDLPALDGYSIFAALQKERPGTYRVVFTTVHGTEEEQLRGLEAGALDYLVKPLSLRVALEKIKRWVGR